MRNLVRLWFGISDRVSPRNYAASGFALMLLKYGVEALAIWVYTGSVLTLWNFLNPLISVRMEMLQSGPVWLGWAIFVWTLPFLWIAITMSVRRAADTGGSPWWGLVVLVPVINLIFMLLMCFVPGGSGAHWDVRASSSDGERHVGGVLLGIGSSLLVGAFMLLASVYLFESYGASLFLGTPLLMGAAAAYMANRHDSRTYASSIAIGMAAIFVAALGLLLFALEGVICIAMAIPLLFPLGALGGVIGKGA